jgi:hypothetical protein
MFRVDAPSIATEMINTQTLWNRSVKQLIGDPMGSIKNFLGVFCLARKTAIARRWLDIGNPPPAVAVSLYPRNKGRKPWREPLEDFE